MAVRSKKDSPLVMDFYFSGDTLDYLLEALLTIFVNFKLKPNFIHQDSENMGKILTLSDVRAKNVTSNFSHEPPGF